MQLNSQLSGPNGKYVAMPEIFGQTIRLVKCVSAQGEKGPMDTAGKALTAPTSKRCMHCNTFGCR